VQPKAQPIENMSEKGVAECAAHRKYYRINKEKWYIYDSFLAKKKSCYSLFPLFGNIMLVDAGTISR